MPVIWECVDDIGDFWEIVHDGRSDLWADAGEEGEDADSGVEAWLNPLLWTSPTPAEKATWGKVPTFPLASDGANRPGQKGGEPGQPPQPPQLDSNSRGQEGPDGPLRPPPGTKAAWRGSLSDGGGAHQPAQEGEPRTPTPGRRRREPAATGQQLGETAYERASLQKPSDGDGANRPGQNSSAGQRPRQASQRKPSDGDGANRPGQSSSAGQRPQQASQREPSDGDGEDRPGQSSSAGQRPQQATQRKPLDGDGANRPGQNNSSGQQPQKTSQRQPLDGDGGNRPGQDSSAGQRPQQASQRQPLDGDGGNRPASLVPRGRSRPGRRQRLPQEGALGPRPPAAADSERLRLAAEGLWRATVHGHGGHTLGLTSGGLGQASRTEWDALYAEAIASGDPEKLGVLFDALRRAGDVVCRSVTAARF
jgi:hypothetical protein